METDNISEEQVEDMETIEENVNESYDSYDELAGEEPMKKGRGRPKGAKNKTKPPKRSQAPPPSAPSASAAPCAARRAGPRRGAARRARSRARRCAFAPRPGRSQRP